MRDKVVIVTGASRGIGKHIAIESAKLGAAVVLFARSEEALGTTQVEIQKLGGTSIIVTGDVTSQVDRRSCVDAALETYGLIDCLVNNAGVIHPFGLISKLDIDEWKHNYEVNLFGPAMLCQAAIPYLRKERGRIINISSGAAKREILGWAAYSTAKAAFDHFTRILAAEVKEITTVGMRPGVVDTSMQVAIIEDGKNGMPETEYAKFVKQRESGKLISPTLPGRAAAVLALFAPSGWSGTIRDWDDHEVANLVDQYKEIQS